MFDTHIKLHISRLGRLLQKKIATKRELSLIFLQQRLASYVQLNLSHTIRKKHTKIFQFQNTKNVVFIITYLFIFDIHITNTCNRETLKKCSI